MARELRRHNESVRFALLAVAALAALSLLASSASAGGGSSESSLQFGYGKNVRYARAIKFCNVYRAEARLRECLTKQLFKLVLESHDSAQELPRIDAYVASSGGYLQRSCHVLMHSVGRRYGARGAPDDRAPARLPPAHERRELLRRLRTRAAHVPRAADRRAQPRGGGGACDGAPTRYQRYSCIHGFGHAYMRLYGEQLPFALHACRLLGPKSAADCAAGAFHDYWIAVSGPRQREAAAKLITSPRVLCAKRPAASCAAAGTAPCSSARRRSPCRRRRRARRVPRTDGSSTAGASPQPSSSAADDPFSRDGPLRRAARRRRRQLRPRRARRPTSRRAPAASG